MALTKERAQARFEVIKEGSILYDFNISLEAGNSYDGLAELCFKLTKVPEQLPLDFKYKELKKLVVNSSETEVKGEDGFIFLDVTKLKVGENRVAIVYRNNYNNDGSGCVSFVDVDDKQYLYTQFESYYANRVFPCYDQPDLKAKMRLNVICPASWKKILSNEYAVVEKQFNADEYQMQAKTAHADLLKEFLNGKQGIMALFPETKVLPTYLFCFVAGEYEQLKIETPYKNIPMSLYSIGSLFKYLKDLAPFIFEITVESLKFYEQFFGYPFSFEKYDQVFVHSYKWGAMENAGIVTFNDIYIWKEKVSTERMLGLANTIAHEMAHHWFGNLVTMKWWDDLWLNESFADFISHFCLEKIKEKLKTIKYESSMASFLGRKGWGYHEDMRVTTHPIRGEVPNTSVADSIFDGITYAKGAATMKQLLFIMQEENFSKALSAYFRKYPFKNATLKDFLNELQNHFKIEDFTLNEWKQMWLQKASLNQLQANWDPNDKTKNAEMIITQTPYTPEHPTLRPHMIKIGLYKEDCSVDVIQTLVKPKQTHIVKYDGSKGYSAILLNYEDHSFVKNVIDQISLKFFEEHLEQIPDILSSTLIWKSFFQMVKDAKMTSTRYVEIFLKNIAKQKSDSIFEKQFDYIYSSIAVYTPIPYREKLYNQVFDLIIDLLAKNDWSNNENRAVILRNKLLSFAQSEENKKIIVDWRSGKFQPLSKHEMSVVQQWSGVVKAFTLKGLSNEQKEKIFEEQKKKDSSDTAKLKRQTCNALIASDDEYEKLYESFKDPNNELSTSMKQARASGWNHTHNAERARNYRDRYFKDIHELYKVLSGDHLELFITGLEPRDDELQTHIQQYQSINFPGEKFEKINREVRKIADDLKRRAMAYKQFEQSQK